MEEGDYFSFFSISFERFAVSAMISFFFFGLGIGVRVKAKFIMDIKWGFFFFFSYRMNILVR